MRQNPINPTMKTLANIFVIAFLFTSCNTRTNEINTVSISDLNYMEISLIDGKPWHANIETTEGVANMLILVQDFSGNFKALHSSLEKEFQTLFMKCSMTGEAHNQLHNYLIPMVSIFEDISKDDKVVSALAVDKLELHLRGYYLFFE